MGIEQSMCCTGGGEHDSGGSAEEKRKTGMILEAKSDHERLYLEQELKIRHLKIKLEATKVIRKSTRTHVTARARPHAFDAAVTPAVDHAVRMGLYRTTRDIRHSTHDIRHTIHQLTQLDVHIKKGPAPS